MICTYVGRKDTKVLISNTTFYQIFLSKSVTIYFVFYFTTWCFIMVQRKVFARESKNIKSLTEALKELTKSVICPIVESASFKPWVKFVDN